MADFPTLAQIIDQHERVYSPFAQRDYCTCGEWSDDSRHNNGHATHGEHVQAVWLETRTITTVEQLDALPVGAVVMFGNDGATLYEKDSAGTWFGTPGDGELLLAEAEFHALLVWHPDSGEFL
mgnify:CR=1 FL=1